MSGAVHIPGPCSPFRAVAVAASLGGIRALSRVLAALPPTFPAPVIALQHGADERLASLLAARTDLAVSTAVPGACLPQRGAVVLPAGLRVVVGEGGVPRFEPGVAAGHAADHALAALANAFGPQLIGVILTGKLDDGADGVRAVKRAGGRVLVQDPADALAPGMPSAALATGCVDFVLSLDRIATALVALTMAPGAADLFVVSTPSWVSY